MKVKRKLSFSKNKKPQKTPFYVKKNSFHAIGTKSDELGKEYTKNVFPICLISSDNMEHVNFVVVVVVVKKWYTV